VSAAKAELARDFVRRVNPSVDVTTLASDVCELTPAILDGISVVLAGVDNERARFALMRLALAAGGVPAVDVGVRADLWAGRVSVLAPGVSAPCLACSWSVQHLARAGVDVGVPCQGVVETGDGFPATLAMGHAAAALGVHAALALAGAIGETAPPGEELRLDLHAGRLERFRLRHNQRCAADHSLAGARQALDGEPADWTLGDLARTCGATADSSLVNAARPFVVEALCLACRTLARPCRPVSELAPCPQCGRSLAAVRSSYRLRWSDAAALAALPASILFRPGDVFAVTSGERAAVFAFRGSPLAIDRGVPLDEATAAVRWRRLPAAFDRARLRESSFALVGLGNAGSAALAQLAPLPIGRLLLVDRDRIETHNLPAHALAAEVAA
jgi:molybdopterin/thiamine biosynthesis adenylyltransferase